MCSSVCRDISKVFETAVKQSKNYHSNDIADKLETINKMWCRLEDDSRRNWYLISETDGKTVTDYYGLKLPTPQHRINTDKIITKQ